MTAVTLSPLGRRAARYAERGRYVFPVAERRKAPKIPKAEGGRGYLDATIDTAQVITWWTRWPDVNIGLWPGRSGLVVIDADGPEGERAARDLGLFDVPTLTCVTGRADGGRHLYFRHPGFHVSNRELAPHLEVRGDDGYVLLPPSVHPSGGVYRWECAR